jgi:hypothetical protein
MDSASSHDPAPPGATARRLRPAPNHARGGTVGRSVLPVGRRHKFREGGSGDAALGDSVDGRLRGAGPRPSTCTAATRSSRSRSATDDRQRLLLRQTDRLAGAAGGHNRVSRSGCCGPRSTRSSGHGRSSSGDITAEQQWSDRRRSRGRGSRSTTRHTLACATCARRRRTCPRHFLIVLIRCGRRMRRQGLTLSTSGVQSGRSPRPRASGQVGLDLEVVGQQPRTMKLDWRGPRRSGCA